MAQSSSRLAADRHARFTPVARASDLGDSSRRTSSFTSEGNASKRSNDVDGTSGRSSGRFSSSSSSVISIRGRLDESKAP